MRQHSIATGLSAVLVAGMSGATHAATRTPDLPPVQIFLANQCPSSMVSGDINVSRASGIVTALLGLGIDYLLDAFGKALSEAAEADKNGRATSAKAAAYLYRVEDSGTPDKKTYAAHMMKCVVIASAPNGPSSWCRSPAMTNLPVCAESRDGALLGQVLTPPHGVPPPVGSGDLAFYAEIELKPSTDARGFIPVLNALYYPSSLHPSDRKFRGTKERDLAITVSGTTPGGEAAISAIHVQLRDIVPQPRLLRASATGDAAVLQKSTSPVWVGVVKAPEYTSPPNDNDRRAFPVNLTAELREVGDPNKFLQFLAKAFDKHKSDLAESIKAKLPENVASAATAGAVAGLDADAKRRNAIAEAYKAIGALETACAKPDSSSSSILQSWYAASAAVATVHKLDTTMGVSPTAFSRKVKDPPPDGVDSVAELCELI